MFYAPKSDEPVPMVVALHSWSADYRQQLNADIEKWCIANGWAYMHPNFRGPNNKPEATGSPHVIADIVSGIEYAKANANIDAEAIYLTGTSGGGYTALMMAGKRPDLWAGVSAWVPITDLAAWHEDSTDRKLKYARQIEESCGGKPGESAAVDAQYRERSPLTHLHNAKGLRIHINAGINDGHDGGSVPIDHTLWAFNVLAEPEHRLTDAQIDYFVKNKRVPEDLPKAQPDESYGKNQPLFRHASGDIELTIFKGGHALVPDAAIAWIKSLHESRQKTKAD